AQEELEVGLNSAAAPVWDQTGRVCAAVSLSGPAYRVTPAQLPAIGEELRDAGMQISRRLGYVPADTSSRTKL
ncbi:MAG: IclR family transcriptional regulator domain-containing protein, partial [Anaerolineae bacterium]